MEVYQPLAETVDVQNVLTDRNLHQDFFLFKVLQTQTTLLLLSHVLHALFIFSNIPKLNFVHDLKVDADDSFCLLVNCRPRFICPIFVAELAIIATAPSHTRVLTGAFLVLGKEKADDFDENNEDEADN